MQDSFNYNPEIDNSSRKNSEDLIDAEKGFYRNDSEDATTSDSSPSRSSTNKIKATIWGSKKKKRSTIVTIIIALVTGGGLGGLSFISGPMQFVAIAKTLQSAHFAVQQDESNFRTMKLFQYMRKGTKTTTEQGPDRTKLGTIGNRLADTIETKLNEAGLKSQYGGKLNVHKTGYTIDPTNEKFKNMSDQQIKDYFKQNYGIDVTGDRTTGLSINGNELSFGKSRFLVKGILSKAGYNNISSVIGAHVMGERDGISWHPLKRLDAGIKNSLDDWWSNRNKTIEDGTEAVDPLTEVAPPKESASGKPIPSPAIDSSAQAAASSDTSLAQTAASEAASSGSNGPIASLEANPAFSGVLKGSSAIAIICLVVGINNSYNQYKEANIILPLVRMGMEAITLGNQVMNGTDVNSAQLGKYAGLLYNSQTHSSWANAQSVQADFGAGQTGPPPNSTLKHISRNSPFSKIVVLPGISTICGRVVSDALNIIGFLTPVATIVSQIAAHFLLPSIMHLVVRWMVGKVVNQNKSGAAYGYNIDYGSALAANDQAITTGGTQISSSASKKMIALAQQDQIHRFDQHSFIYRTFSFTDPQSLLGHFIVSINPNFIANVTSLESMILNMGHTLATLPLQLLSGTVFANTNQPYNYGFPDYGYTQSELNNPAVNNPYQNATEVAIMLNNNTLGPIIQKESLQCFGVSFVDGTSGWDTNNSSQPINLYDSTYRQQGCGAPNGLSAQQWLQVRMFIFDTQTIKGIDCYEGNNNSCISNGFTGAVAANFTNPSPRITLDYMGLS